MKEHFSHWLLGCAFGLRKGPIVWEGDTLYCPICHRAFAFKTALHDKWDVLFLCGFPPREVAHRIRESVKDLPLPEDPAKPILEEIYQIIYEKEYEEEDVESSVDPG